MSDVSCPSGKRPLLDTNQLDNWGCIVLENVCMDQVRPAVPASTVKATAVCTGGLRQMPW